MARLEASAASRGVAKGAGVALALGDVLADGQVEGLAVGVAGHGDALDLQHAVAVIAGGDGLLVGAQAAALEGQGAAGAEGGALGRHQVFVAGAQHLGAGDAEQLLAGAVDQDHLAVDGVAHQQGLGDALDHGVEEGAGLGDLHLGLATLGDVEQGAQIGRPAAMGGRAHIAFDEEVGAIGAEMAPAGGVNIGAGGEDRALLDITRALLGGEDVERGACASAGRGNSRTAPGPPRWRR